MSWHPAKILALCSCSLLVNFPAVADDQVAFTSLLPDSVVAYIEVRQPDQLDFADSRPPAEARNRRAPAVEIVDQEQRVSAASGRNFPGRIPTEQFLAISD